jgi:hypothetical protein
MVSRYAEPTPQQGQRVAMQLSTASSADTSGVADPQQTLTFAINPENLSIQLPSRVTTVNTIGGAYQDNWGRGVGKIQISGTTGWMKKSADGMDGYQFVQALKKLHAAYQDLCTENNPENIVLTILLPPGTFQSIAQAGQAVQAANARNALNEAIQSLPFGGRGVASPSLNQFGYYRVSADNLTLQRSRSQPLLFQYTWEFTILRDLLETNNPDPSAQFKLTISPAAAAPLDPGLQGPPPSGGVAGADGTPGPQATPNSYVTNGNPTNPSAPVGSGGSGGGGSPSAPPTGGTPNPGSGPSASDYQNATTQVITAMAGGNNTYNLSLTQIATSYGDPNSVTQDVVTLQPGQDPSTAAIQYVAQKDHISTAEATGILQAFGYLPVSGEDVTANSSGQGVIFVPTPSATLVAAIGMYVQGQNPSSSGGGGGGGGSFSV